MRILIADDHGIMRQGLRSLIEADQDMEVIGEAEDGCVAVSLAMDLRPDIIIMDVTMPKLNGIEATRQILKELTATKIIALSMHTEGHIVRETLDAGALGYVLKSSLYDDLSRALHTVATGQCYLSPRITDVLVSDWLDRNTAARRGPVDGLTSRQRRILQLTAEGKTVKEIALQLEISPKTVHANRRQLMDKLSLSTVADLTRFAISQGLTTVDF